MSPEVLDASSTEERAMAPQTTEASAVVAHRLLNSSAVVWMGITTLQAHWDGMPSLQRAHLLERMLAHASVIDDRLKDLTWGRASPDVPF
jgi:hypothetical protein